MKGQIRFPEKVREFSSVVCRHCATFQRKTEALFPNSRQDEGLRSFLQTKSFIV